MMKERLENAIRTIPDFPKEGIQFKDITPLFLDPALLNEVIEAMKGQLAPHKVDAIVGIESRGFLFGVPLALAMDLPFVLVRKPGKLPADTIRIEYDLEYGSDALEIHADSLQPGQKVVVIDDLMATGGTAEATAKLIEKVGAEVVAVSVMIDLAFLKGADRLAPIPVHSLLQY
jgi:adenine phosphoribosyltransferase